MSKKRLVVMAFAGILLASQASSAATVVVGHCRSGLVSFATIQGAVNAVPAGSTIYVCPGTYPEQVEITKRLTMNGVQAGTQDAAVIVPPATGLAQNAPNLRSGGTPIAAQIWVHDVDPTVGVVNINNLTVDGANNLIVGCSPSPMGIVYQNASGTAGHVAVRNHIISPYSSYGGCQAGYGILVQTGSGSFPSAVPFTSKLTVSGSTVHNFQKNGIVGQQPGTTLLATGNTVLGLGPTTGAAQNGIEIVFGATGKITGNSVADFDYSPNTAGASGLLIFDSGNVTVSSNTVANTQLGIALVETAVGNADTNLVNLNKVYGTHVFDGIDVCSDHNTVKNNTVNSSDEAGIHLDSSCTGGNSSNTVSYNTINEACAGVLIGPNAAGNITSPNTVFNVSNTIVQNSDTCSTPVFSSNFAQTNLAVRSSSMRPQP